MMESMEKLSCYDNVKCGEIFCVSSPPAVFNVTCIICDQKIAWDKFIVHFESQHLTTLAKENHHLHDLVIEETPIEIVDIKEEAENEVYPQDDPIKADSSREQNDIDSRDLNAFQNQQTSIDDTDNFQNASDVADNVLDENKSLLEILKEKRRKPLKCGRIKNKSLPQKAAKQKCPERSDKNIKFVLSSSIKNDEHSENGDHRDYSIGQEAEEDEEYMDGNNTQGDASTVNPITLEPPSAAVIQGPRIEIITGLECDICGQPFSVLYNMQRHRIRHTGIKEHKCQQCPKAFFTSNELQHHMETHTNKIPFKCDICGKDFSQMSNMKRHRIRHTGIKEHKCQQCSKEFYTLKELSVHLASHTNKPKELSYKYSCPDCDEKFRTPRDLKGHQLKIHIGIKCDICGQEFSQLGNMRMHRLRHTGIKEHKCQECSKDFFTLKELKAHMLCHTGIWPHICEVCGKRCRDGGFLSAHMRRHTGERPAKCEVCGKCFYSVHDLNVHSVTHSDARPFECDICGSKFRLRKSLRIHKRTHLPPELRKHVCGICNKTFTQSGNLKKHLLIHDAAGSKDITIETVVVSETMPFDNNLMHLD